MAGLNQFVVVKSQLESVAPVQSIFGGGGMIKSTEEFATLLDRFAMIPKGSEPIVKAPNPAPAIEPLYLIKVNCPTSRLAPETFTTTVPCVSRAVALIMLAVGLPVPRLNSLVAPVLLPRISELVLSEAPAEAIVTPSVAPSATVNDPPPVWLVVTTNLPTLTWCGPL